MKHTPRTRWLLAGLGLVLLVSSACTESVEHASHETAAQATQYHCPMHPTYISDKPGDCPICGMKLVPVYDDKVAPPTVSGRAAVVLPADRRQLLGVSSAPVRLTRIDRVIRTVGRIAPDERRLSHVHTKVEGVVERLFVDFTGKLVRKGDRLLSIYSPDLVATQQEFLLALRAHRQLSPSSIHSVSRGGADLLQAARERLLLWDIRPQEIAELERSGKVQRTLDLFAETSGYVTQKNLVPGTRVVPSDTLFEIADLSRLWILADVYESDLPAIRLGMTAEATLPSLPGATWQGTVTYIAPAVEEKTRTIKIRIEVDNRSATLKPEMFADVLLHVDLGSGLVVPNSAIIDAGDRKLVFIDGADGRLEPREVQLGARLPEASQILRGVSEGERVVTSANFLLDSESSLKAALSSMSQQSSPPTSATAPPAAHRH